MNEILTVQVGNYSNYIGTHYWNLQVTMETRIWRSSETGLIRCWVRLKESQFVYASDYYGSGQKENTLPDLNHDCLFREGLNKQVSKCS